MTSVRTPYLLGRIFMNLRSYNRWYAALLAVALLCSEAGANETSPAIQQNIDELIRSNSCVGCDLRGADLNRMILADADLSNADLSGATFFLADLSGANLSGANLRDAKFGGADLAGADLRGADLRGALLDGAFLKGSMMDGKVIETGEEDSGAEAEAPEKVYVPDETKPKEVMDQNQAALTEPEEKVEVVVPEIADNGNSSKGNDTVNPIERKTDGSAVGPAGIAPVATPSQLVSQDEPKELKDQKKSIAAHDGVESEAVAAIPPGEAPPVKKTAPVKEAQVESTQQSAQPLPDSAKVVPVETEPVSQADMVNKEDEEETTPVENTAAAPVEEKTDSETDGTTAEAMQALVEKLLDTNRCYECDLSGVDLSGEDLSGSDLEGSDLSGAILNDTDLAGTNLKGVSFEGAQMRNADLRRADLYKANLRGADLSDADFRGALTDDADFSGAIGYQPSLMVE